MSAPKEPLANDWFALPIKLPVGIVLLLAGSSLGWFARPIGDPEYVSKVELLEHMQTALTPITAGVQANAARSQIQGAKIDVLLQRVDRLERLMDDRR